MRLAGGASELVARTDHARTQTNTATMSISTSLQASARAAYRDLLRASALTFQGDDHICHGAHCTFTVPNPSSYESWSVAFRTKMRAEVIPNSAVAEPAAFEEKVKLAREIADILRKNVVQARRVEEAQDERWRASHTCL